ncbi:hypothetical protein K439DRAFT_1619938 [Ramaria rubella]|nr:hypothetical protein K439DRAFT_1619938 [Ramaria rubella]
MRAALWWAMEWCVGCGLVRCGKYEWWSTGYVALWVLVLGAMVIAICSWLVWESVGAHVGEKVEAGTSGGGAFWEPGWVCVRDVGVDELVREEYRYSFALQGDDVPMFANNIIDRHIFCYSSSPLNDSPDTRMELTPPTQVITLHDPGPDDQGLSCPKSNRASPPEEEPIANPQKPFPISFSNPKHMVKCTVQGVNRPETSPLASGFRSSLMPCRPSTAQFQTNTFFRHGTRASFIEAIGWVREGLQRQYNLHCGRF